MEPLALVQEERQAGLRTTVDGDSLHIVGPKSTAPIVERIRQNKAEVIGALRSCRTICAERRARPDPLGDGCELHGVTADDVAHWWTVAQERGHPSVLLRLLCWPVHVGSASTSKVRWLGRPERSAKDALEVGPAIIRRARIAAGTRS